MSDNAPSLGGQDQKNAPGLPHLWAEKRKPRGAQINVQIDPSRLQRVMQAIASVMPAAIQGAMQAHADQQLQELRDESMGYGGVYRERIAAIASEWGVNPHELLEAGRYLWITGDGTIETWSQNAETVAQCMAAYPLISGYTYARWVVTQNYTRLRQFGVTPAITGEGEE